ncbi:lipase [Actinomycetes bacterium]|nr:lipase [Actinomycetes bacterium]
MIKLTGRRSSFRTRALIVFIALGALLIGVTPGLANAAPAPDGLPAFYKTPSLAGKKAGTLLKSQKVAAPSVDGTVYRVMYVSETVSGQATAVTGLVVVPKTAAPKSGYPVVSWGHGTNGMTDECAPSLEPSKIDSLANGLLANNWVITASDYQGEGTPGLHPYLAGVVAAQNTIDIVRAAEQLPSVDVSKNYVVWGHSQGGQTAMYAHNIAPKYAPELNLKGVVAGAPPSQFDLIYDYLKTSKYRYYLLMSAGGLNAAYGDKAAPLDKVLTPKGIALLDELDKGCSDYLSKTLGAVSIDETNLANPFSVPEWKKLFLANDPKNFTSTNDIPLLIIHGGADEQIPTVSSQLLTTKLCGLGQGMQRWVYPGQSHSGVIATSATDMVNWMKARFAGGPVSADSAPSGQTDTEVTGCPK